MHLVFSWDLYNCPDFTCVDEISRVTDLEEDSGRRTGSSLTVGLNTPVVKERKELSKRWISYRDLSYKTGETYKYLSTTYSRKHWTKGSDNLLRRTTDTDNKWKYRYITMCRISPVLNGQKPLVHNPYKGQTPMIPSPKILVVTCSWF